MRGPEESSSSEGGLDLRIDILRVAQWKCTGGEDESRRQQAAGLAGSMPGAGELKLEKEGRS